MKKVERRRKRIYSFFFCRDASYLIQRCKSRAQKKKNLFIFLLPKRILSYPKMQKSSAEEKEFIHFSFAETHPILSKDAKVERRRKRIYSFFFCRDASYLIQRCKSRAQKKKNLFIFLLPKRIQPLPSPSKKLQLYPTAQKNHLF